LFVPGFALGFLWCLTSAIFGYFEIQNLTKKVQNLDLETERNSWYFKALYKDGVSLIGWHLLFNKLAQTRI